MKYPRVQDGEPVRVNPPGRLYKIACCDCALVHRVKFQTRGREIIMRAWRDNRATAALRREDRRRKRTA